VNNNGPVRCFRLIKVHILQEPELVDGILESIQNISDEARRVLADPELPRDSLLSALSVRICVKIIVSLELINVVVSLGTHG
jgi:hypothetical protein